MYEHTSTFQSINTWLGKKLYSFFIITVQPSLLRKTVSITNHFKWETLISTRLMGLGCPPTCYCVCLWRIVGGPASLRGYLFSSAEEFIVGCINLSEGTVRVVNTGHVSLACLVGMGCPPNCPHEVTLARNLLSRLSFYHCIIYGKL